MNFIDKRYQIITTNNLCNNSKHSLYICNNITSTPETHRDVIINAYSSDEHIDKILPLTLGLDKNIHPFFLESFTGDSILYIVFKHKSGLLLSDYLSKNKNTLSSIKVLELCNKLFHLALKINIFPEVLKPVILNMDNIYYLNDNEELHLNINLNPDSVDIKNSDPINYILQITKLIQQLLNYEKRLPEIIKDYLIKCKNYEYANVSEMYSQWRILQKHVVDELNINETDMLSMKIINTLNKKYSCKKKKHTLFLSTNRIASIIFSLFILLVMSGAIYWGVRIYLDNKAFNAFVESDSKYSDNSKTVSSVDMITPIPTPFPTPTPIPDKAYTLYTVEVGDTLSKISLNHYGNEEDYILILEANEINNENRIYQGQEIKIPSKKK